MTVESERAALSGAEIVRRKDAAAVALLAVQPWGQHCADEDSAMDAKVNAALGGCCERHRKNVETRARAISALVALPGVPEASVTALADAGYPELATRLEQWWADGDG